MYFETAQELEKHIESLMRNEVNDVESLKKFYLFLRNVNKYHDISIVSKKSGKEAFDFSILGNRIYYLYNDGVSEGNSKIGNFHRQLKPVCNWFDKNRKEI